MYVTKKGKKRGRLKTNELPRIKGQLKALVCDVKTMHFNKIGYEFRFELEMTVSSF